MGGEGREREEGLEKMRIERDLGRMRKWERKGGGRELRSGVRREWRRRLEEKGGWEDEEDGGDKGWRG